MLIIGGFFIWLNLAFASSNDIVINEIAWTGTTNSANDEWIELYNPTTQEIDLTGWTLTATDGTPNITLEGILAANGYFLLERTDDSSAPNVIADQIYTGALGNSGEKLELRDDQNNLIDSVDCSDSWLTGDNSTKQTMERTESGWQTSQDVGGTPKTQNSTGEQTSPPDEQPDEQIDEETAGYTAPTPINQPPFAIIGSDIIALVNQELSFDASQSYDPNNDTLIYFWNFGDGATDTEKQTTHTYTYPGQYLVTLLVSDGEFSDLDIIIVNIYSQSIIISEFMPDPQGKDEQKEWIELFNQNNQVANLTNWQLDDQEGGSQPFTFPANTLIAPKQFLVIQRLISKIALNNDTDQVRLIYPDGSIGAEVSYLAENKQGFSIAFDGSDYFWTKIPTPSAANIISLTDLENQGNYSSNNPEPIIQQTQEPQILATTTLTQNQNFDAQNPSTTSVSNLLEQPPQNNPKDIQSASLAQKNQNNQKANLILYISIIISASLLISWAVIQMRKRVLNS